MKWLPLLALALTGCTTIDFDPTTRALEASTFGKARLEITYDAEDGSMTIKSEGDGVSEGFAGIVTDTVGAAASVFGGNRAEGDTVINVNVPDASASEEGEEHSPE